MATPRFTTYSFKNVTCAFGPIIMDGFQAGEGITVEHNADAYSLEVGIDGKATRSQIMNRSCRITVNLAQSSAANDLLSAVYLVGVTGQDLNGVPVGSGADVAPFIINDRNGRTKLTVAESWIARAPDLTFDQPSTVRAWLFDGAFLDEFQGGN
jgi:structural protein KPP10_ORF10